MDEAILAEEEAIRRDICSRLTVYEKNRGNLIPILQMIQQRHAYLPTDAIKTVAEHLNIPVCEVYGVATFYNQFRFNPPGRHPIRVCLGTACHVRAGDIILENFERKLGIKEGETTADREFSVERVACVGCCALAPVAVVDEVVQGRMAPSKVEGLILRIRMENERSGVRGSGSEVTSEKSDDNTNLEPLTPNPEPPFQNERSGVRGSGSEVTSEKSDDNTNLEPLTPNPEPPFQKGAE